MEALLQQITLKQRTRVGTDFQVLSNVEEHRMQHAQTFKNRQTSLVNCQWFSEDSEEFSQKTILPHTALNCEHSQVK